ncbi:MAG: hypothetical protein IJ733_04075, partial [Lachnospiraceae bacterium]|nr:hypothetical protein [Lachnospiraceae bacterium]
IRDSAYAVIGQMYRATGGEVLKGAGEHATLDAFMEKQLKNKAFAASLKSKHDPKKFIPPKEVARLARDEEHMRHTGETYRQANIGPKKEAAAKKVKRAPRQAQKDDKERSVMAPK